MKKVLLLLSVVLSSLHFKSYSQAGVYLYIPSITNGAGTGTHADEATLSSAQSGMGVGVSRGAGGGGASVSQPSISDFVFTKQFDLASLKMQKYLLMGSAVSSVEIRYYNTQSVVVYAIKFDECYISGASQSNGGDGCSSGCQSIAESYSITPTSKITWQNALVNPNQVLTYDFTTGKTTYTP